MHIPMSGQRKFYAFLRVKASRRVSGCARLRPISISPRYIRYNGTTRFEPTTTISLTVLSLCTVISIAPKMASKQLGKLKQWAGEVVSSNKTTLTDEFRELETDVELRRGG